MLYIMYIYIYIYRYRWCGVWGGRGGEVGGRSTRRENYLTITPWLSFPSASWLNWYLKENSYKMNYILPPLHPLHPSPTNHPPSSEFFKCVLALDYKLIISWEESEREEKRSERHGGVPHFWMEHTSGVASVFTYLAGIHFPVTLLWTFKSSIVLSVFSRTPFLPLIRSQYSIRYTYAHIHGISDFLFLFWKNTKWLGELLFPAAGNKAATINKPVKARRKKTFF